MSNWNKERTKSKLQSIIDSNFSRYTYDLARYMNDITIDLQYISEYNDSLFNYRFYSTQDSDLEQPPKMNVIKSVIDAIVSKLANQKVRPYFTPVNGLFTTRKITKQAQQYFDIVYNQEHVQDKISLAYRNSCIFGIGYLFFNPILKRIEVPGTWQVAVSNPETAYGKPTKLLIEYKSFPVTHLDDYGIKGKYTSEYVNFKLFFDAIDKKLILYINDVEAKDFTYKADILPIISIYHTKPVVGNRTISIVEELEGIQTIIDYINKKISTSAQLTPGNVTYVQMGSNLTREDISNRTGAVYQVKMSPGTNNLPVVNVTPAPADPSWQGYLDYYWQKAYNQIGVSELSATSKKPAGLNSGVSLETMEDIESDRFQTQVDSYVHAFVDLANLIIEINDDKTILPRSVDTAEYSWEDVRKQKELFKIQFSAASALSKDPSTKIQQIMQLTQLGLITTDKIAMYLDSPDLEDVYRGAAAIIDAIELVISNAVENDKYDIPEFVGYEELLKQIIIEQNKLFASDDKQSVERLEKLKQKLLEIMDEEGSVSLSNDTTEPLSNEQMTAVGASPDQLAAAQANSYTFPNNIAQQDEIATPTEAAQPIIGGQNV